MVMVTTVEAMVAQFDRARAAVRAKNGGEDPPTIRAAYDIDREAFCLMIEALNTLAPRTGMQPDGELLRLAQIRPVDELL
jgi:hypothetical protein